MAQEQKIRGLADRTMERVTSLEDKIASTDNINRQERLENRIGKIEDNALRKAKQMEATAAWYNAYKSHQQRMHPIGKPAPTMPRFRQGYVTLTDEQDDALRNIDERDNASWINEATSADRQKYTEEQWLLKKLGYDVDKMDVRDVGDNTPYTPNRTTNAPQVNGANTGTNPPQGNGATNNNGDANSANGETTQKQKTPEEILQEKHEAAKEKWEEASKNNESILLKMVGESIKRKAELAERKERNARSVALANALGSLVNVFTAGAIANKRGTIPIVSQYDKEPDTDLRKAIEGRYAIGNENEGILMNLASETRKLDADRAKSNFTSAMDVAKAIYGGGLKREEMAATAERQKEKIKNTNEQNELNRKTKIEAAKISKGGNGGGSDKTKDTVARVTFRSNATNWDWYDNAAYKVKSRNGSAIEDAICNETFDYLYKNKVRDSAKLDIASAVLNMFFKGAYSTAEYGGKTYPTDKIASGKSLGGFYLGEDGVTFKKALLNALKKHKTAQGVYNAIKTELKL